MNHMSKPKGILVQDTVVFTTPGILDLRFLKIMGASVKETNNPIGTFGTGLKYALAVLLREGCSITIHRGLDTHEIGLRTISLRGVDIQVPLLDGEELPFTVDYGKNWSPLMAYRELVSNTWDEGGTFGPLASGESPFPEENTTKIIITGGAIVEAYGKHSEMFLTQGPSEAPIAEFSSLDIWKPTPTRQGIFYKGIKVYDFSGGTGFWAYNIKNYITLTEDRSLGSLTDFSIRWERLLSKGEDPLLAKLVASFPDGTWEGTHMWLWESSLGPVLCEAVKARFADKGAYLNRSLLKIAQATDSTITDVVLKKEPLTPLQDKMLKKALWVIEKAGYPSGKYPIKLAENLGINCFALARLDKQDIHLDLKCFTKGTKFLVATLWEEIMHLETGFADETREFQDFLFEKIVDLWEEFVIGEPL